MAPVEQKRSRNRSTHHFSHFFLFLLLPFLPIAFSLPPLHRSLFPSHFSFGTASSAFQYEGATNTYGRGPSIWDAFSSNKNNIVDQSNATVADDEYHRYREDVDLMSAMGMDSYRFSISWSRIFPEGTGRINQLGVDYYNNVINALLEKGIQPFVTLYHWDLPQALQDAYGGWLSPRIVEDYAMFAETCFKEFGDRVKYWITFNEPTVFILEGYNNGLFPPNRCSNYIGTCSAGNSSTEPYIAAHNVLLSHAAAVDIYRKKYQGKQKGSIGITLSVMWFVPLSNSSQDAAAVKRSLDFSIGWFLDPIMFGDYPPIMRMLVGNRLPEFSQEQRTKVQHSIDFVGINYYTTYFASDVASPPDPHHKDFFSDSRCNISPFDKNGVPLGPMAASIWLYIVPSGIYNVVNYLKGKYANPTIFITENGVDEANNGSIPLKQALKDHTRVQFYKDHLWQLAKVTREGADVRGFFAWSLLDNFEWIDGYSVRFGLHFVDYQTLKRYPKTSARWFTKFLTGKRV